MYAPQAHPPACFRRDCLRAETTVRRQRSAGVEADFGSADLSRWALGRLHGADCGRGGEQKTAADLHRAAGWRYAQTDHPRWAVEQPSALVARFPKDRLYFGPQRIVPDL